MLDEHLIGPNNDFVCGDRITLADYLGIAMLTLGEAVHLDYSHWRNVSRWIAAMKARPSFAPKKLKRHGSQSAPSRGSA